jgi:L-malate glycosyltransferase
VLETSRVIVDSVVAARSTEAVIDKGCVKLAFVLHSASIGGAESNLLDFLTRVEPPEFECKVVTLNSGGAFNDRIRAAGVPDHSFTGSYFTTLMSLAAFFREWRPEVVHLYGLKANLLVRPIARMHNCKVVCAIRGANPNLPWHHVVLDRATTSLVDWWIANSDAGKAITARRNHVSPERMSVIRNGIDAKRFMPVADREAAKRRLGFEPDVHIVVHVGNLRPMKGHVDIMRAIPPIIDRCGTTIFLFVGQDQMQGVIQAEAKKHRVEPHIRFMGEQHDVRPFLAAADVFLLPSLHEGLPTAILEAMSMSLPVVATSVGGIPELVVVNETGFLIAPRDPDAIAHYVVNLLLDPELCARFGRAARERVLQYFTLDHMVNQLRREYVRIARGCDGV